MVHVHVHGPYNVHNIHAIWHSVYCLCFVVTNVSGICYNFRHFGPLTSDSDELEVSVLESLLYTVYIAVRGRGEGEERGRKEGEMREGREGGREGEETGRKEGEMREGRGKVEIGAYIFTYTCTRLRVPMHANQMQYSCTHNYVHSLTHSFIHHTCHSHTHILLFSITETSRLSSITNSCQHRCS